MGCDRKGLLFPLPMKKKKTWRVIQNAFFHIVVFKKKRNTEKWNCLHFLALVLQAADIYEAGRDVLEACTHLIVTVSGHTPKPTWGH